MTPLEMVTEDPSTLTPPRVLVVAVGSCAGGNVPLVIFEAFVVSVVADVEKDTPLVFVTVKAPVEANVASPLTEITTKAEPPAFPTCICPALGIVFGTIEALVWVSLVTEPNPTSLDVTVTLLLSACPFTVVVVGTAPKSALVTVTLEDKACPLTVTVFATPFVIPYPARVVGKLARLENTYPVQFVNVPDTGVPRLGAVNALFDRVCVSEDPTTVPDGGVFPDQVSRFADQASVLVPITKLRSVGVTVTLELRA